MTVPWQPWMRWLDPQTGELRPGAPLRVKLRYRKYRKELKALQDLVDPDAPDPDENGAPPMPEWIPTEELIRLAKEQEEKKE